MTKIEVLGTGCAKCDRLEKFVRRAAKELSRDIEILKVDDIKEIVDRGVMMTPALYVDGEAMAVGRVPSVEEIKSMLTRR